MKQHSALYIINKEVMKDLKFPLEQVVLISYLCN